MRRTWNIFVLAWLAVTMSERSFAAGATQSETSSDVTTFMGIPVDGKPAEVKRLLKEKGFKEARDFGVDFFSGEYDGEEVVVCVACNKGKVARIGVTDATTRRAVEIRKRFNDLVLRYRDNENYIEFEGDNKLIDENEDVGYELHTHDKIYEADFYQRPVNENAGREKIEKKFVWFKICESEGYYYIVTFFDNEYNQE